LTAVQGVTLDPNGFVVQPPNVRRVKTTAAAGRL